MSTKIFVVGRQDRHGDYLVGCMSSTKFSACKAALDLKTDVIKLRNKIRSSFLCNPVRRKAGFKGGEKAAAYQITNGNAQFKRVDRVM